MKLVLFLQGRYAGRILTVRDETVAVGEADGWLRDLTPLSTPYDMEGVITDPFAPEPQSLIDWYNAIDPPNPDTAPVLTSLNPATAEVGGADVTLHCIGTGFSEFSVIIFNGGPETTTFVSATEVTTTVEPSTASGAVTVPVAVRNGYSVSNSLDFTFTEPAAPPEE